MEYKKLEVGDSVLYKGAIIEVANRCGVVAMIPGRADGCWVKFEGRRAPVFCFFSNLRTRSEIFKEILKELYN